MGRFSLIGPSNPSQSPNADAQRTVNWYVENADDPNEKSARKLYPTPGLKLFGTLGGTSVRGDFEFAGRFFAVSDTEFAEFTSAGAKVNNSVVAVDGNPVTFAANHAAQNQLIFASGGLIYLFNLTTNVLSQPAGAPTGVLMVAYSDGYFVALLNNSNTWQLSNSLDGTTWSGLMVAQPNVFPDNIVSMIVEHREVSLLGTKQSVFNYDSGNTFPYDVVPGGFMEIGCAAAFSVVRADNTSFFLATDERGGITFRRVQGYTPVRVSTSAIEQVWESYSKVSDCVAYSFTYQGHTFIHLYFPSGTNPDGLNYGASWRYDCATQTWHEVAYWDTTLGVYKAHKSQCHAWAFGKHLVGDPTSGKIYEMAAPKANAQAWDFCDDAGNPIRRLRRSGHVSSENHWIGHTYVQFDLEAGLGPVPALQGTASATSIILASPNGSKWNVQVNDAGTLVSNAYVGTESAQTLLLNDANGASWQVGITNGGLLTTTAVAASSNATFFAMVSLTGQANYRLTVTTGGLLQTSKMGTVARDPQLMLRWSDDGGHTWSKERILNCGQRGKYKTRVMKWQLGVSRDRVYEISCTDAIPWRIIDGYLMADGYQVPTPRLKDRLGQMA